MPVRGERQRRSGVNRTSAGGRSRTAPCRVAAARRRPSTSPPSRVANAERHQRRSVVEIDARSSPSRAPPPPGIRSTIRDRATPSPRTACARPSTVTVPRRREMRPAVVVARLLRRADPCGSRRASPCSSGGAVAAKSRSSAKSRAAMRAVYVSSVEAQRPVADVHVGRRLGRLRQAESRARRALVVPQPAVRADRRSPRARTAVAAARSGSSPSSATPGRLRKNVIWTPKSRPSPSRSHAVMYHHSVRNAGWLPWSRGNASAVSAVDGRIANLRAARGAPASANGSEQERAPLHQSSFTARTASPLIAPRALTSVVAVASTSSAAASASQRQPRHVQVHAPVERLAVDDVDQDQAHQPAERQARREADAADDQAFGGQHARRSAAASCRGAAACRTRAAARTPARRTTDDKPDQPDAHRRRLSA